MIGQAVASGLVWAGVVFVAVFVTVELRRRVPRRDRRGEGVPRQPRKGRL